MSVTGACMAIHRSKFKRLGGFDETFIICGSDVELGIRAHGVALQNVYRADVVLRHYESKTRGRDIPASDFEQSMMKYAPYRTEKTDPFFNPNLSLMFTKPALKK
jgi:GT2 family glycosyltransferase